MCKISIRNAALDDAVNITVLKQQVWISTYAVEGIRQEFSDYVLSEFTVENERQNLHDLNVQIVVAMQGRHLIGCAEFNLKPSSPNDTMAACPELTVLYVLERFVGRGVGQQLLDSALIELKTMGFGHVWLTVYHENERANCFYNKNGFHQIGEAFFEMDGNQYKNWILKRAL